MQHTIEPAASGRAKCRACGRGIAKGELRLGERLPNPFADEGAMTIWFHLPCGAYRRPEALLAALEGSEASLERSEWLKDQARLGLEHHRLPRAAGVERSSSGRAACRSCREKIDQGSWRIRLAFFEDGRFTPGGFLHPSCATDYLGTSELLERLLCFSAELGPEERTSVAEALESGPPD